MERTVKDYKVIQSSSETTFSRECSDAVRTGWQPYGYLKATQGESSYTVNLTQAFVKY